MRAIPVAAAALAAWLLAAPGEAHEGGAHARGTVKEITADRIVLATPEGTEVVAAIAPGTRIYRGHRLIPVAEVRPGERAVVHSAARDGKREATEVIVAEAAR